MALIECPECGREVSSSAPTCPACAYPVRPVTPTAPPRAVSAPTEYAWWKTGLSMLGRVFVGAVLAAIGADEEESVAAVIGGVVIAGSAIPTWYRAKIARLRAGRSDTELEYRLADRMAEFEQRQMDRLDRLERVQTGQMAELEERIDFTERVLSKREQIGPG